MADAEGSADPQISFKVKTSGDGLHSITMAESATVLDLKTKLATEEFENIPVERQRLIYSGRVMKNDDTLGSYKIKAGNTLHLVKSAASNHTAGSAAAGAAGARSSAPPPAVPTNMAAGTPANDLLAGLTGARFAGHVNLPNQDVFGPDGGMNFATEDQISEMLSNPAIAQSMNEALNNPAFIDYLIQTNPTLRNVPNAREMIQSPMFRSMLTNPETMRAMSRMRSMMGGGGAGSSPFPAPGATDNTPADAASSPSGGAAGAGAGAGGAGASPFGAFNPFMFGFPGAAGGAAGGDGAAANPFAAFFPAAAAGGAAPGAAADTGASGATGANTTAREGGDAAAGASPGAGAGTGAGAGANATAANPFASLFGGAGGLPQITPEQMQQAMQMLGGMGGGAGASGAGAGAGGFNPFAAFAAPAQQDTRSPEEQYASQLRQLNEMGFYDFDQNVAALRRSGGSVEGALAHLLGN
ncbi:hypothetical protein Sste5346_009714 [Sporothrix stenoceras]|uniref:Ubiquilin n=1 Tax=Sporothrix stenoceras TaxID=5173 RepID=A0ABR3YJU9_9PEZI